ncbi:MAG: hypothetical protein JW715_00865 [Sedimentisphaerales bacterium]|nr:hypothetical protein [Sedimentisphaerales bacterium]
MSKTNDDKKSDINVLRARDLIPPYHKENSQEQKQSEKEQAMENVNNRAEHQKGHSEETQSYKEGIPTFDLAKQIMSEQRKVAAVKRKRTNKKNEDVIHEHKNQPIDHKVKSIPTLSRQEQIIAEIVKRDIEMLRKK